ncbi:MAG: hypothetical protein V9G08_02190 [Dermatophilaceae bacterium]
MTHSDELSFDVEGLPPAKNEALSLFAQDHAYADRVLTLLLAARQTIASAANHRPLGSKPIALDVTLTSPTAPRGDPPFELASRSIRVPSNDEGSGSVPPKKSESSVDAEKDSERPSTLGSQKAKIKRVYLLWWTPKRGDCGEDSLLVGCYTSRKLAESAKADSITLGPGRRVVDRFDVNDECWVDGFVTIVGDDD